MKNLMKFKSVLLSTLVVGSVFFTSTSCTENKVNDSRDVAEKENMANQPKDYRTGNNINSENRPVMVISNDDDTQFLMDAAEMQHENISLGKLAQQKGSSDHVRALGKMMVEENSKSLTELSTLAQSKSIAIPSSATENSNDFYKKLNEKNGNDFSKTYSKRMVDQHEDAIDLYEKAVKDTEDAQVKAFATNKLVSLRTQLKKAEDCREKSNNEQ
ncbi:DUF4142 domain-containing protein [Mongoliitalea daihaiensis]|uniref:DUF4142 domain-containing protein n=1 Tax=Mongoliitalea daihaiensis TaxID=2782006 RepID=UPI001F3B9244|nr:DUF4142 domain-containing protein [Mongoliitalea daihaiensis]UJP66245.1 DUF4142 domain-containing protein [Mongoliitalea daihaiensis]